DEVGATAIYAPYQSERKPPPLRAGESSTSLVVWETTPVPQCLRDAPPVERWPDPLHQRMGQTGTAQDLPPVGRVGPSNSLPASHGGGQAVDVAIQPCGSSASTAMQHRPIRVGSRSGRGTAAITGNQRRALPAMPAVA